MSGILRRFLLSALYLSYHPMQRPRCPAGNTCMKRCCWLVCLCLLGATRPSMPTLIVELPQGLAARAAVAEAAALKLEARGTIGQGRIEFGNLLPRTAYDLRITLADGTLLRGVNMGWYNEEAPAANPEPLDDDDREQIRKLVSDVRQFYDRSEILLTRGDHDRATVLVRQIRDSAFHSGKDDEVIWRIELWYFKNQHGGWERISQQNKVLERQRFASRRQYQQRTDNIKWVAELGGVVLGAGPATRLTLAAAALKPTTAPATQP